MRSSQQRIDCTANSAVSLVIPTLTKPALAVTSYTPLEGRAAKARRRDGARDPCPPLSAGHVEVEQDRAPAVLPHHAELARPAADGSPCRSRADRRDDDQSRPESRKRTRHTQLPEGHQDQQS